MCSNSKSGTEQECQTAIHCWPHVIEKDQEAAVVQDDACQTIVQEPPDVDEENLINRLQLIENEELCCPEDRLVDLYLAYSRVQWRFPAATTKIYDPNKQPAPRCCSSILDVTAYTSKTEVQEVVIALLKSGTLSSQDSLLQSSPSLSQGYNECECQTNLTVCPIVLSQENPFITVVCTVSVQTSITKLPTDTQDDLVGMLKSYRDHKDEKGCDELGENGPSCHDNTCERVQSRGSSKCAESEPESDFEECEPQPELATTRKTDDIPVCTGRSYKYASDTTTTFQINDEVSLKEALEKTIGIITTELEQLQNAYLTLTNKDDPRKQMQLAKRPFSVQSDLQYKSGLSLLYEFPSSQRINYEPYLMHLESELKFEIDHLRDSLTVSKQSIKDRIGYICVGEQDETKAKEPAKMDMLYLASTLSDAYCEPYFAEIAQEFRVHKEKSQCMCVVCTCDLCKYLMEHELMTAGDNTEDAEDYHDKRFNNYRDKIVALENDKDASSLSLLSEKKPKTYEPYFESIAEDNVDEETKNTNKTKKITQTIEPVQSMKPPESVIQKPQNVEPEIDRVETERMTCAERFKAQLKEQAELNVKKNEESDTKVVTFDESQIKSKSPAPNTSDLKPLVLMYPSSQKAQLEPYIQKLKKVFPENQLKTIVIDSTMKGPDDCTIIVDVEPSCCGKPVLSKQKSAIECRCKQRYTDLTSRKSENQTVSPKKNTDDCQGCLDKCANTKSADVNTENCVQRMKRENKKENKDCQNNSSVADEDDIFCDCQDFVDTSLEQNSDCTTIANGDKKQPCVCDQRCEKQDESEKQAEIVVEDNSGTSTDCDTSCDTQQLCIPNDANCPTAPRSIKDFQVQVNVTPKSVFNETLNLMNEYIALSKSPEKIFNNVSDVVSRSCLYKSLSDTALKNGKLLATLLFPQVNKSDKTKSTCTVGDSHRLEKELKVTELTDNPAVEEKIIDLAAKNFPSGKMEDMTLKKLQLTSVPSSISNMRVPSTIKFELEIDCPVEVLTNPHILIIRANIFKATELEPKYSGKFDKVIRLNVKYQKREANDVNRPDTILYLDNYKEPLEADINICKRASLIYILALADTLYREPHIANIATEIIISTATTQPGDFAQLTQNQTTKSLYTGDGQKVDINIEAIMANRNDGSYEINSEAISQPIRAQIHGPGTFTVPVNLMISVHPTGECDVNRGCPGFGSDSVTEIESRSKLLVFSNSAEYHEPYAEELLYGDVNFGPTNQIYESDVTYNEPYVDALLQTDLTLGPLLKSSHLGSEEEYETSSEGRSCSKTDMPWDDIMIPPTGTLDFTPPPKEEGEEGEEKENLVPSLPPAAPSEPVEPIERPPEFDYVFRHDEKFTEPYMDKMSKAFADPKATAAECPPSNLDELPWGEIMIPIGARIVGKGQQPPQQPPEKNLDTQCTCKPTCKRKKSAGGGTICAHGASSGNSTREPSPPPKASDFRQFDVHLGTLKNQMPTSPQNHCCAAMANTNTNTMANTNSHTSTKSSYQRIPKKSPKRPSLIEEQPSKITRFVMPDSKSFASSIIPIKTSTICEYPSNMFKPGDRSVLTSGCKDGTAKDDPIIMAFADYEKEIRPLRNALSQLQYKIQSMHLPELQNTNQSMLYPAKRSIQSMKPITPFDTRQRNNQQSYNMNANFPSSGPYGYPNTGFQSNFMPYAFNMAPPAGNMFQPYNMYAGNYPPQQMPMNYPSGPPMPPKNQINPTETTLNSMEPQIEATTYKLTAKTTSISIKSSSSGKVNRDRKGKKGKRKNNPDMKLTGSTPMSEMYSVIVDSVSDVRPKSQFIATCAPLRTDPSDAIFKTKRT